MLELNEKYEEFIKETNWILNYKFKNSLFWDSDNKGKIDFDEIRKFNFDDVFESYIGSDFNNDYSLILRKHNMQFSDFFKEEYQSKIILKKDKVNRLELYIEFINPIIEDMILSFKHMYDPNLPKEECYFFTIDQEIADILEVERNSEVGDTGGYTDIRFPRIPAKECLFTSICFLLSELKNQFKKYDLPYYISKDTMTIMPTTNSGIYSSLQVKKYDNDHYQIEVKKFEKLKAKEDENLDFNNSLKGICTILDINLGKLFKKESLNNGKFIFNEKCYENLNNFIFGSNVGQMPELIKKQLKFCCSNIHHNSSQKNSNESIYKFTNFEYNYWWNFINSMIDIIDNKYL
jgi:hypothetical protein